MISRNGFAAAVTAKLRQVKQKRLEDELNGVYNAVQYFDPRNYVPEEEAEVCSDYSL